MKGFGWLDLVLPRLVVEDASGFIWCCMAMRVVRQPRLDGHGGYDLHTAHEWSLVGES
jgi:hypothetical protein